MKISQPIAHFRVEDGKPTAVPLPYRATPLLLKPEVAAEVARLLSAPGSEAMSASPAASNLSGGPTAATQDPVSVPPFPAVPAMRWGIASAALQTHDWSSLLIPPSALGLGIAARGQLAGKTTLSASPAPLPQNMAPLDPQLWLAPRPSEAVNRQELQPLSPRLFLRPLPVSRIALENASHVLAVGQITLEPLPSLGVNPSFLPQLNTVLDGATAVVAVAEIIQESTRPTLHGVKRLLYYLKRLLYLTKFITDVVPVAPTVQHTFTVVGLVVKGTDELHSVKLKASRMQKLA